VNTYGPYNLLAEARSSFILQALEPFAKDEYQACSGEASVAARRALTKGENTAGAKARLYFMAFTARLKSCPDTKQQRIHTFAWMPEIA